MSLALLYHLLVVHGLWYAPIFGWLLLVSAWARRTAFLWAALPPLAIGVVEKIAFNTSHFAAMLGNLIGGGGKAGAASTGDSMSMGALVTGHPLSAPSFWVGLAFAAACLAAAVRLRRNREPI
jgi:ABC-2 type transport system permease protein